MQRADDFLRFAEGVAEEHGHSIVGVGFAAKGDHAGESFRGRREDVAREAEGRLHDEGVGAAPFGGLGGEAWAQFEIAGVEQ